MYVEHVVVVQYTKQCVYWIPHPHKNVCRHQDIYPMLTSTGYIVNLMIFGTGHMARPLEMYMLHVLTCCSGPMHKTMLLLDS